MFLHERKKRKKGGNIEANRSTYWTEENVHPKYPDSLRIETMRFERYEEFSTDEPIGWIPFF